MNRVSRLVQQYFTFNDGQLEMGGVKVGRITSEWGTPLFIYNGHVLDQKWMLLRDTLPREFAIYYSVKANPNPTILRHFLAKGCGLEVASGGEFHLAVTAGCPPDKIIFAGPGKTEAELELVLSRGIGEIHIESPTEMARISAISRRLGTKARVAIRVNPSEEVQGGAMLMGGRPGPFGIDEENLPVVVERIKSNQYIEFTGIHLFVGTQILDHKILIQQYRKGLEIANRVASQLRQPLQTLDFGGGLGIPYFVNEQELAMNSLKKELAIMMDEIEADPLFKGTQFVVEPGRYLVGEAGIYVTKINDIKISRGKKFLVVDGGMNHHLAASGNLGQVIKRNFPVAILNRMEEEAKEVVDIVGPLCTPLDVLARDIALPTADVGDLIGVFQSGAYARTASPLGFLSHPSPAEVLVYEGDVTVIRRRATYDDLLTDIPHIDPLEKIGAV